MLLQVFLWIFRLRNRRGENVFSTWHLLMPGFEFSQPCDWSFLTSLLGWIEFYCILVLLHFFNLCIRLSLFRTSLSQPASVMSCLLIASRFSLNQQHIFFNAPSICLLCLIVECWCVLLVMSNGYADLCLICSMSILPADESYYVMLHASIGNSPLSTSPHQLITQQSHWDLGLLPFHSA